jgi:cell division initiation protein
MDLTPKDIYNKEFSKQFSVWSYDEEEVDEFLDLIATYYEELLKENQQLEAQIKELEQELEECRAKQASMQDSVQETLHTAEEAVENKKQQAEKEADLIIEEAEIKADKIIQEAEDKAQKKYQDYRELVEAKRLFKIKFKTLLKSYLELLDDEEVDYDLLKDRMEQIEQLEKEE